MSTLDTVFLIITACALSLFFLLGTVLLGMSIALVARIKKVVVKAESAIDSVEAAADVFKDAGGKLAVLKLVKNIINLVQRKKK